MRKSSSVGAAALAVAAVVLIAAALIALSMVVVGTLIYFGWNLGVVAAFGVKPITYVASLGLALLVNVIGGVLSRGRASS